MASYCSLCKTAVIWETDGVVGACSPCAESEIKKGSEWLEMLKRFVHGRPAPGEKFSVVREVARSKSRDGFLAMESVGSSLVDSRLRYAERFPSETEAREALGI